MSGSIRDTVVGAYAETEQSIDKVTALGAYAETEVFQLDATIIGMYVEVQEDEMLYDTVVLPQGIGAKYQNVPLLIITRR
jgi:hypothetical protein